MTLTCLLMVQGDCESRNAGTQNGLGIRNGSTMVKFSVHGAP